MQGHQPAADNRRVVVVTGAAGGIGADVARRFADDGALVALLDIDLARATKMAASIQETQTTESTLAVRVDLRDPESIKVAATTVAETWGRVDVLVNNAAAYLVASADDQTVDGWNVVHEVGLRGTFLMTQALLPQLRSSEAGRVVNLSSAAALGRDLASSYSAAKMGVQGLTRSLAIELGPDGITVNAVAPGFVVTPMSDAAAASFGRTVEENRALVADAAPMRRVGYPADIAEAINYFASPAAGYVTGQTLYVDGGSTL